MTTRIQVSHGLCTPIRAKVLTALEPYEFKGLRVCAWGEGRYGEPDTLDQTYPDSAAWVQRHVAVIEVSDAAAAWAEWLLWQSGQFALESKPLNPRLNWHAPKDCKAQSGLARGVMPTPWRERKQGAKPARRKGTRQSAPRTPSLASRVQQIMRPLRRRGNP